MIACYKGHFKIAKYLIDIGADVNRKSVKGNTALHDCAESGSLEIMKLLIGSGARIDVDAYGMTPLLAASVTGHLHIVEHLIGQRELVGKQERIDALELLGATFVDKKRDMLGALKLWKRAMEERYEDGVLVIPKTLVKSPIYADMGHFERCITLWMYALDMQQKILEPLSPMTQSSLLSFAELFSFMMSDGGRSRGQIRLANLGGGARAAADLPINENMNQSSPPPVSFADIMTVFKRAVREVKAGQTALEAGEGRRLDLLQPHHRHPPPPRLSSHQAYTPSREGE